MNDTDDDDFRQAVSDAISDSDEIDNGDVTVGEPMTASGLGELLHYIQANRPMTDDEPTAPSDPRPDDEPYYIDSQCQSCGTELVLYDELPDEKKRTSDDLASPDTEDDGHTWHDEWVCPLCLNGVHMDWPDTDDEDA